MQTRVLVLSPPPRRRYKEDRKKIIKWAKAKSVVPALASSWVKNGGTGIGTVTDKDRNKVLKSRLRKDKMLNFHLLSRGSEFAGVWSNRHQGRH